VWHDEHWFANTVFPAAASPAALACPQKMELVTSMSVARTARVCTSERAGDAFVVWLANVGTRVADDDVLGR
jgi:hypothetical protein